MSGMGTFIRTTKKTGLGIAVHCRKVTTGIGPDKVQKSTCEHMGSQ
jgi:hypothetical protein